MQIDRKGLIYVAVAVCFFSLTPVLVRWEAASLTAYEIVAGRLLSAAIAILLLICCRVMHCQRVLTGVAL